MVVLTSDTGINLVPATSESEDVIIDFVANVQGVSSTQVSEIEVHETHVRYRVEGESTTSTVFVPWSNIKSIRQVA